MTGTLLLLCLALLLFLLRVRNAATWAAASAQEQQEVRAKRIRGISQALSARKTLLTRAVTVTFHGGDKVEPLATWNTVVRDHPAWIVLDVHSDGFGSATFDRQRIAEDLAAALPVPSIPPVPCAILSSQPDEKNVLRADTTCVAEGGYRYDLPAAAAAVAAALMSDERSVDVQLQWAEPLLVDEASGAAFALLSTGRSSFQGSGEGRKFNVRKALNEHLNNVLIPVGAVFSFNDTLGEPISTFEGWKMALVIVDGGTLQSAPGGGICQASTTMYRAALLAGLPIVEQKNHSLYVNYYEAHGVGQDATVFPGRQDLKFRNDTGAPLLIQAFNRGDEAYVNIFGTPDGRTTTLSGPYFASTVPEGITVHGRKVQRNEIVWVRTVKKAGMTAAPEQEVRISRYQAIPRSLPKKWEATTVQVGTGKEEASIDPSAIIATAGRE